ncbi:MAG: hypothetical protein WAJ82_02670, partial [Azonexus sp.]
MATLDGALLHGVQRLQAGNDFAARKDTDIELAASQGAHPVGQHVGTAVPFGMNNRQMNAWIYYGGGQKLLDEFYSNYNI